MKTSGIIYPDENQDKEKLKNTYTSNLSSKTASSIQNLRTYHEDNKNLSDSVLEEDKIDNYLNIPSEQIESGSMDVEIENKQFNYDLPQKNTKYYSPTDNSNVNDISYRNNNAKYSENKEESNISKSFKIDHQKAEIKRKKYSRELDKLKKDSAKKKGLKTQKGRGSKTYISTNKAKAKNKVDKKKELKTLVEKANINDDGEKKSISRDLFSLNIVENILLRYVVAIISGIILFGIIFTGLGLISGI